MRTIIYLISSILIASLFAACQPSSTRDSVRKSDLVGSSWELIELTVDGGAIDLSQFDPISLEFRQDLIGGATVCNTYQVGWQLGRDGQVRVTGPILQTKRGCLDEAAEISNSYTTALADMRLVVLEGDTLIINSGIGQLIFMDAK